jgi:hypothetical protein
MNLQRLLRQEQSMMSAEGGSHVYLRTSDHRDHSCGKKAVAEDSVPAPPPPPQSVCHVNPTGRRCNGPIRARARAARRSGYVTRRAVTSGPWQRVRGVGAKSGTGSGASAARPASL